MNQKIAKFDILGLSIPLQPSQNYHDCGFLNDEEFKLKLKSTTAFNEEKFKIYCKECGGRTCVHGDSVEIFCRDYNNHLKNIIVKGHEETQALKALGKIKKLEKVIDGFLNIKISELEDEETMADIGGIYAAKKAGYTNEEIVKNSFDIKEAFILLGLI